MKNTKICLAFVTAFLTLTSVGFAATNSKTGKVIDQTFGTKPETALAPTPIEGPIENLKAQAVFERYMDIEHVRRLYRSIQWEHLGTPEDTAFTHFFYNANEYLGKMLDKLKVQHVEDLENFSLSSLASRKLIRPGYGIKRYDRLYHLTVQTAASLGFSGQAIKNLELYLQDGPLNAFTVSGNNERIIVVLNKGLVETLSTNQVRAVIAHELGHIRSLHSAKGSLHQLFMLTAMQTFAPEAFADEMASNFNSFAGTVCENFGVCHHGHHESQLNSASSNTLVPQAFSSIIVETLKQIQSIGDEKREALVRNYIYLLLKVMIAENASPHAIQVFKELLQYQPGLAMQMNVKNFISAANEAMKAVSRAQEKSADNYSMSAVPSDYTASVMALFSGEYKIDNDFIDANEDREKISKMLQDQYDMLFTRLKGRDVSRYMGSTHPASVLRFIRIINSPNYPYILFANPLFRLLMLEDSMTIAAEQDEKFKPALESLRNEIVDLVDGFGLSDNTNSRYSKLIQYFALNKRVSIQAARAISANPPEKKANKNFKAFYDQVLANTKRDAKGKHPILLQLKERLQAEIEKQSHDPLRKQIAIERLQTLEDLMTTQSVLKLKEIQAATFPKELTKTAVAKNISTDVKSLSSPHKDQACSELLRVNKK